MPKADQSYSINTTHKVFNRLQDAAPALSKDVRQLFRTGAPLDASFQQTLPTVMQQQLCAAAQTRVRSARQRGLIISVYERRDLVYCRAGGPRGIRSPPADLWMHVAWVLGIYDPLREVVVIRLPTGTYHA